VTIFIFDKTIYKINLTEA